MTKQIVFTKDAPAPIGPYSQAVKASGNFLFVSGQIACDADGNMAPDDIPTQTEQVCKNLQAILTEAGLTFDNVVKATVFLSSMGDFAEMNGVYAKYFGESKPARATIESPHLPKGTKVEIELIAVY